MEFFICYNLQDIEVKWYDYWLFKNYFYFEFDECEFYSIVILLFNVIGVFYMGYMFNNIIQDIFICKVCLEGKNVCWVLGMDYVFIVMEAKVVKMLCEWGIKKFDLSCDEFMKYVFEWKDKYGGIIFDQFKKLGVFCDWECICFIMEDKFFDVVFKVFVDFYNKGKVYCGLCMINWDLEV